MKLSVALWILAFSQQLIGSETPSRRIVGLPASDILGSAHVQSFFPPGTEKLDSASLKRGEIRIRIIHRGPSRSVATPSARGIAAEIRGVIGTGAIVFADHSHEAFDWKESTMSDGAHRALLDIVLDERFLSMKRVRPLAMGSYFFQIEIASETLYGCFFADWVSEKTDERGLRPFQRAAAALLKEAGFEPHEVFWGPSN